jgi:hypothetical protein
VKLTFMLGFYAWIQKQMAFFKRGVFNQVSILDIVRARI